MRPVSVCLRKFVTGRWQYSPQEKSQIITFFLFFLSNLCQAPFSILRGKAYTILISPPNLSIRIG